MTFGFIVSVYCENSEQKNYTLSVASASEKYMITKLFL